MAKSGKRATGMAIDGEEMWDIPPETRVSGSAVLAIMLADTPVLDYYQNVGKTPVSSKVNIMTRKDIADTFTYEKIQAIQVQSAGSLLHHVEAVCSRGERSPATSRAMMIIKSGLMSQGRKLMPAFIAISRTNATSRARYYLDEDIQNWLSFVDFCLNYKLDAETVSAIASLPEAPRGFCLYHLWTLQQQLSREKNNDC